MYIHTLTKPPNHHLHRRPFSSSCINMNCFSFLSHSTFIEVKLSKAFLEKQLDFYIPSIIVPLKNILRQDLNAIFVRVNNCRYANNIHEEQQQQKEHTWKRIQMFMGKITIYLQQQRGGFVRSLSLSNIWITSALQCTALQITELDCPLQQWTAEHCFETLWNGNHYTKSR